MSSKEKSGGKKKVGALLVAFIVIVSVFLYGVWLFTLTEKALSPEDCPARTATQQFELDKILDERYAERTSFALSPLPYTLPATNINVEAKSAIIIDTTTGSVIYEKNADIEIPPASLTKIVEMFVVFQAAERGEVSLDDEVPLPPASWSENLPSDASRMYLAKGQHVTLRELLLGLAIVSGNDASIAVANYVCKSMDEFVARMNQAVKDAGLTVTHFVESSGYSDKNITTAREFATFARMYINKYPFSLSQFHAKEQLRYPLTRNLSDEERALGKSLAITRGNTNKLLGLLKGCDGLKTGYIDESGYNISVTARDKGTRFLSVTLGGPGSNTEEGNKYRVQDNMALFNFAFRNFIDYNPASAKVRHEFTVGLLGSSEDSVRLVPALSEVFTVPFIYGESVEESASSVFVTADIPDVIYGNVNAGDAYGVLYYKLDDKILRTVPLVADRDTKKAGLAKNASGYLAYKGYYLIKDVLSKKAGS